MQDDASSSETVLVTRDAAVTQIGINRPHVRNTVDRDTAARLADAFRAFDADDAQRVAVLHGVDGTFCAGAESRQGASPAPPNRRPAA